MNAADVMTRKVLSVSPSTSVAEAATLMLDNNISGVPVTDADGHLLGILSEGDFLHRTEIGTERRHPRWLEFVLGPGRLAGEYVHAHGRKVEEVMTRDVASVTEHVALDEIVRLMERRRIKRVPVIRDGKLVGIVTRASLLRALASVSNELPPSSANDIKLRKRLLAELEKQPWFNQNDVDVMVRNGVVQLWGVICDERQREALHVAVENTGGVKGFKDNLVWIEPISGVVIDAPASD